MSNFVRHVIAIAALAGALAGAGWSHLASATGCFWPPVETPVTDHFRAPECPYCAGNRGLEYAPAPGTPVRALAAGTVTFVGPVADITYLVIRHADGRLATYGRLASVAPVLGQTVVAGALVATTTDGLYVGLREGDTYLDPEPLIGRLHRRPRLVPVDGTPARPSPAPTLTCEDPS